MFVTGQSLRKEKIMATCEVCGNEYDKCFRVTCEGETHTFDSFECAIHALGPAVRPLWLQDRRARGRAGWDDVLLRCLRQARGRPRGGRPRRGGFRQIIDPPAIRWSRHAS